MTAAVAKFVAIRQVIERKCIDCEAYRDLDRISRWIHPGTVDTFFGGNGCKLVTPWLTESRTVISYENKHAMKPGTPSLQSTHLLDQVRERF